MLLKKKKLPLKKRKLRRLNTVTLRITPTPYLPYKDFNKDAGPPYGKQMDRQAVVGFYHWLVKNSPPEGLARYQIAEALDVHAIVVDEWLMATDELYLTLDGALRTKAQYNPYQAESQKFIDKKLRVVACSDYDPWTDRSWDNHFKHSWQPYFIDTVVDKYYSVFTDEVFLKTGKRRRGFTPTY